MPLSGQQSSNKMFHAKLIDYLSDIVLKQVYSALCLQKHVYFIIDTEMHDISIFKDKIMEFVRAVGKPYVVKYEKLGKGESFAKIILPLIFLRSEFSVRIAKECANEKIAIIFKSCVEGSGNLFHISKKFLECKKCSSLERKKLGLDYDLSKDENALDFFRKSLQLYVRAFNENPIFIFEELEPNFRVMSLSSTLSFLKELEELPTVFLLIIPKQLEYCVMPLWDKFPYVRLSKVKYEDVVKLIEKISDELTFTERGVQLFCGKMRNLYGNEISAKPLITALDDLLGFKKVYNLNVIDADNISKFFSISYIEVNPPTPRPPSKCKSPYFGSEVERLTKECTRLNLDPHKALPFPFRYVLWHIRRGNIEYNKEEDFFIARKYLRASDFKKLSKVLNKLGYEYRAGTRKWVFSPKKKGQTC